MIEIPGNKEQWAREDILSYALTQILKEKGWDLQYSEKNSEENKSLIKNKYKILKGNFYECVIELLRENDEVKIKFIVKKREGFLKKLLGKDKYVLEFKEKLGKFVDKSKRLREKTLRNFLNSALSKLK